MKISHRHLATRSAVTGDADEVVPTTTDVPVGAGAVAASDYVAAAVAGMTATAVTGRHRRRWIHLPSTRMRCRNCCDRPDDAAGPTLHFR